MLNGLSGSALARRTSQLVNARLMT